MNELDRMVAIEDIRRLKATYFMVLDAKDFDAFGALFTDNAQIDVRGSVDSTEGDDDGEVIAGFNDGAVIVGGKAMAEFVRGVISSFDSVHQGFMPQIDILSESTAKGVWAMQDRLWPRDPSKNEGFVGFGHYHETYVKTDIGWKIDSMKLIRQRVARL